MGRMPTSIIIIINHASGIYRPNKEASGFETETFAM